MSSDLIENVDDSLADISTKKLNGVQRLLEAGLLFFTAFALFMILALLSFDQADPGWAQTGYQTPVRNLGGTIGAHLSDLLLNLFGLIAYSLPFVVAITGWLLFQKFHKIMELDYLTLGLKLIGFFLFYLGVTSLASMNFDDVFYFSAGGIVGDALSKTLLPYLSFVGSTLFFLLFACAGFVLLTGFSWLKFIDSVGKNVIAAFMWLITLPAFIKEHFGTSENDDNTVTNKFVAAESDIPVKSEPEHKAIADSSNHVSAIELTNAFNTVKERAQTMGEISAENDKAEPFIDIEELLIDPAPMNVQEHVSEKEITAAFANVEKLNVADDEVRPYEASKPVEQNLTNDNGQVNLVAVDEDKYKGMPSIDLLDRPDKAKNPVNQDELDQVSRLVEAKLLDFGVQAQVVFRLSGTGNNTF